MSLPEEKLPSGIIRGRIEGFRNSGIQELDEIEEECPRAHVVFMPVWDARSC